ncbi:MAG: beta-class carbonic anhydrase [Solirubrobacteraceae bacterium]
MGNLEQSLAAAAAAREELAMPGVPATPRRKLAVLTCMDVRIDPIALLGIERGDAHVIRNAGAIVTDDAIRSLSVSQRLLGTTEVLVVMHERCGLCGASDEEFAAMLASDGASPPWRLGGFAQLEQELAAALDRLRSSPELPCRQSIRGLIFDPESGSLREPGR